MSINSKMTAIASKIRGLLGISEAMGMDAMAQNLDIVQSGVDGQVALLNHAIDVIQNKAAGSGGVELPELDNPEGNPAEYLAQDWELIDQNGEKVVGTIPTNDYLIANNLSEDTIFAIDSGIFLILDDVLEEKQIINKGIYVTTDATRFGDATPADVTAGKTFTSENGLKLSGTKTTTGSGSGGGTTGPFSAVEEFEWTAPSKFTPTTGGPTIEHSLGVAPDGFILTALSTEFGSETEDVVTTVVLDNSMLYADVYPLGLVCGTGKSFANISTSIWLDTGDCRTLNNIMIIFELSSKMVIPAGKRYRVLVYKR